MKGFLYGQTEYNLLESSARLEDYVARAKKNGFDYLTITDSAMYGCYKFYTACEKVGIKPILGLEYSMVDMDNLRSCVLLYAKNNKGYQDLIQISSNVTLKKWDSLEDILEYKNEMFFIFAYDDSLLERLFKKKAFDVLDEYLEKIKSIYGYIGIAYTNHIQKINEYHAFSDYAGQKGVPVVPLHQLKYILPEDSIVYDCLTQMSDHPKPLVEFDDYSFLENPKDNPIVDYIVSNCSYDLFHNRVPLPKFPNTKGANTTEYLQALCYKGLERRGKYYKEYISRLEYELAVIHRMGYDDYFLIVWDFVKYSKQNGILVGPGRGSAAGSLVAYCLGITEVDPLQYDLLFERFLNPERVSMPDIDTDFPDCKRDMVIEHVRKVYGDMHVCNIAAFGTFKVKSSVNELGKIFKIESSRLNKIVDMIEERGYDSLLEQYQDDPLEKFFYVARGLEGLPKHISTHAAGIILSADSLDSVIPLTGDGESIPQSQYEAVDLEKIGLLKMDFLGISNLTMIEGMMKDTGFTLEKLRNIPLDDPKVYKLLQNADTLGIFQMEKAGFRSALRQLKPTEFNDIVAMLALYRPGPMDNIPEYVACKHGKKIIYLHPHLESILKDTYGVIVYQEQIMKIAQLFAGYSLGEADLLRRAVSKKDASKLLAMQQDFVSRSIRKGYSKDVAENIYALIYKFADYGFNKSHSVAYALFAYQMLYFKANYFQVFMSNIMNNVISNTETMVSYINYAKARGLVTQKPNINVSTNKFVYVKNWLFMPLNAIRSIGETVALQIVEEREKNGLFRNFEDFKTRVKLPQSTLQALVYAGALDVFGLTKKSMLDDSSEMDSIFFKHMENRITVTSDYEISILREKEKEYIGINLEYSLFKNIDALYKSNNAISLALIKEGEWCTTIACFTEIKEIKTKKGDVMLVGTIEDDQKSYHITIFPKAYQNIPKNQLDKKSLYAIRGKLEKDNREELSFSISNINKVSM